MVSHRLYCRHACKYSYIKKEEVGNVTRQTNCVTHNIEACSWVHHCNWKAISITYFECVFLALCVQREMRVPHVVVCGLSGCTIFYTWANKGQGFRKKVIEHKMCVLIFSTTLSKIFFILRRSKRDMIKMLIGHYEKCPFFLPNFNESWTFSKNNYQISWKSVQREPSCSMRLDRHDEAWCRFSQFLRTHLNVLSVCRIPIEVICI